MISMNEEKAVYEVLSSLTSRFPESEIIIVDSSTDNTPNIIKSFNGVKLIRQYPPIGYGPAMNLALKSASRDIIVTLDCDNTYPVSEIQNLVYYINKGYDLVDGSRLKNKPKNMPFVNYLANIFFGRMASIFFLRNLKDLHSGMRAYTKSLIHSIPYNFNGPALPVELLLLSIKLGYKIKIHFISYHLRLGDSKMNPLPSAWWTLKRILTVRFKRK